MSIIKKTIFKKNKIELKEITDEFIYLCEKKHLPISLYSNINIYKTNPYEVDINFSDYDEIDIYIKFNSEEEIIKLKEQYSFKTIDSLPGKYSHLYGC